MSIPGNQVLNVRHQSQLDPLPQGEPVGGAVQGGAGSLIEHAPNLLVGAANEDHLEAARQEVLNAPPRTYVSVANLHLGNDLASNFHRVNPSDQQIRNELGEGFEERYDIDRADRGRMAIPKATLKEAYKHDFEAAKLSYNELHQQLRDAERARDNDRSLFSRFVGWFNRIGNRSGTPEFKAVYPENEANTLRVNLGVKDGGETGKIEFTLTNIEKPIDAADDGEDRSVALKKALYGVGLTALVGVGAGAFAAIGAVTAVVWAPFVLGAVGVGAIGGGLFMAGKLMFGKHPWWGGTIRGKIEHAERAQARGLADKIEDQVCETALRDNRPRNVDAQGARFQKRDVISDEVALKDFILLAKTKGAGDLKRAIRQALLNKETSPLTGDTIDYAKGDKKAKWHGFAQGRPRKHAEKTVDIYAEEIAQGIMRGVSRAVVQSRIGELSDELSEAADRQIAGINSPVLSEFTRALNFLNPAINPRTFPIAKTGEHINTLSALLGSKVAGQQGTIDNAIQALRRSKESIGTENETAYTAAMQTFKQDVEKHVASLGDIENLIVRPQGAEQPAVDEPGLEAAVPQLPPVLEDINEGILSALDGRLNTLALIAGAESRRDALADGLKARVQNAEDPHAQRLVETHAQQFLKLVDETSKAGLAAVAFARAETEANLAFQGQQLTVDTVRDQQSKLNTTKSTVFNDVEIDPSTRSRHGLVNAKTLAFGRMETQLNRCQALLKADEHSKAASNLVATTTAEARTGNLATALGDNQTKLEDLNHGYGTQVTTWAGQAPLEYQVPQGLSIVTPEQWKRELFAAYLDLPKEKIADLQGVLDRLIKNALPGLEGEGAMKALRAIGEQNSAELVSLLEVLQQGLPAQVGQSANVQVALGHLEQLRRAGQGAEQAREVAAALHSEHKDLLVKAQSLQEVLAQLQKIDDEIGSQLRDLTRVQGADAGSDDRSLPALLGALVTFLERNPQAQGLEELRKPGNLDDLRNVTAQLRASQAAAGQNGQGLVDWLIQADAIEPFENAKLGRVQTIIEHLTNNASESYQSVSRLHKEREVRLAQAVEQARSIVPDATSSKDAALRQKVMEDAAPKNEAQRETLKAIVQELLAKYGEARGKEADLRLKEEEIQRAAEQLQVALGFKGTSEELVQKIKNDPYMGLLLWRYMDASARLKLAANHALPGLDHKFKEEDLVKGAAEFASAYVAVNEAGIAGLVDASAGPLVTERNRYLQRLKEKNGTVLPADKLQSKLKNSDTWAYVEGHLYENRVYDFLQQKAQAQTSKNVRAALEKSYDNQEGTLLAFSQLREQVLAQHSAVEQRILQGLEKRISVLRTLLDKQTQTFGAAGPWRGFAEGELSRLQGVLAQLNEGIRPLLESPSANGVKMLGRMMLEADEAINATEEALELAYIRGQQAETARALRHFDVRKLSEATGWSNVFFRLFKRGEANLRKMVANGHAQEISRDISLIAAGSLQTHEFRAEQAQIDERIQSLQQQKKDLSQQPQTVNDAYALLMMERLAEGAEVNEKGAISQGDHEQVTNRLKEMLGDNAELHSDVMERAKAQRNIESLLASLGVSKDTLARMQTVRLEIERNQEALAKDALELKGRITQAAIEKANAEEQRLIESATRLGLQRADYLVLKGLMPEQVSSLINEWGAVFDNIEAGKHADAWAQASDLRLSMENTVKSPKENKQALQAVLGKIEAEMQSSMPVPAPLESYADPNRLAAKALDLYNDLDNTLNSAKQLKSAAASVEKERLKNKVETDLNRLAVLLADFQYQAGESQGNLKTDKPYSLRTAQLLGVACQSRLGSALNLLNRSGVEQLSDETQCQDLARYHLYNARLIENHLHARAGYWVPTEGYTPRSMSDYAGETQKLKDELANAYGGLKNVPKEFTSGGLKTLKSNGEDELNRADIQESDDEELSSAPVVATHLTSAMIGGEPAQRQKTGLFGKFVKIVTGKR